MSESAMSCEPKRKRGYRPPAPITTGKRDKGAPPVIPEQRADIIEAAKAEILQGQSSLAQIAPAYKHTTIDFAPLDLTYIK